MHEAGSHTVVIGDVLASDRGAARPLAYSRRAFARPVPLQPGPRVRDAEPRRRRAYVRG